QVQNKYRSQQARALVGRGSLISRVVQRRAGQMAVAGAQPKLRVRPKLERHTTPVRGPVPGLVPGMVPVLARALIPGRFRLRVQQLDLALEGRLLAHDEA